VTLKRGVDFDQVVFGISIGSLPALCPQLLAQSPALLATSEKVKTVATQAYQVWLDKDLAQMGWTTQPAAAAGAERLHRTVRHLGADGPAAGARGLAGAAGPRNVSYFCSACRWRASPVSDHGFPARMAEAPRLAPSTSWARRSLRCGRRPVRPARSRGNGWSMAARPPVSSALMRSTGAPMSIRPSAM
jgi:hypothetical protein